MNAETYDSQPKPHHFWWSYAEHIASRDQIPAAAEAIARVLATPGLPAAR